MRSLLYFGAPLFNLGERYFNERLASNLEREHDLILPQRDGFIYTDLLSVLEGQFKDTNQVARNTIFYLDNGHFIPKSKAVIANINEPIDVGVFFEVVRAKQLKIPTIGYRNDMRGFDASIDKYNGAHTFAAYQLDTFITLSPGNPGEQMDELVRKILFAVELPDVKQGHKQTYSDPIIDGAQLLFDGLTEFHSPESLEKIISRYKKHQKILENIEPRII